jgi:hypothetical protein
MNKFNCLLHDIGRMAIRSWMSLSMLLLYAGTSSAQDECGAYAGTLMSLSSTECLVPGGTMILAEAGGDALVPEGYETRYVLTLGEEMVIMATALEPMFSVTALGMYRIHTLVYSPLTLDLSLVQVGTSTAAAVNALLIQGGGAICAALDLDGVSVMVADPDAGGLSAVSEEVCLTGGTAMVAATPDGDMEMPDGFVVRYVLSSGEGLVIEQMSNAPSFTVSSTGMYTVHTLVYDPTTLDLSGIVFGETTGFEVNAMLVQGGGSICAALDAGGASVEVVLCGTDCLATTGTLTAVSAMVCLEDGSAMLHATAGGAMTVPEGFEVAYVLTSGPELVIQQTGSEPHFMVSTVGAYTIHTLVYDPMTLDLSIVVPGTTTGFMVNAMLLQGGGEICAALDVTGASIMVTMCEEDCMATTGTLTPVASSVCLEDGVAMLHATAGGAMMVPDGYEVAYVLTSGTGLVIQQTGEEPHFFVNAAGAYTIHTLVYDPMTLDLSIVVPGTTTGFMVNALLVQGGGEICAALDVAGASITVTFCDAECTASAGTLFGYKPTDCLQQGGTAIGAIPAGNAHVPAGYMVMFVLTEGPEHTIVHTQSSPIFTVNTVGHYTIHTLVYDPSTLDVGTIVPGTTTAAMVNAMLIQGGGSICASLDLVGTSILVDDPVVGTITANNAEVCLDMGEMATISATAGGHYVPEGYLVRYVLTKGPGLMIQQVSTTPSFMVDETGDYTIHTLVYDPATLDLGVVVLGVTTGFDINAMLFQGGGNICAALDVAGTPVVVVDCAMTCLADAGSLMGFKPVFCYSETGTNIGAIVVGDAVVPSGYQAVWLVSQGGGMVIMDMNDTPYFIVDGDGLHTIHTLVYHPVTFDISTIQYGVTTAAMLNAMLVQGGGEICASLDMTGVEMIIDTPLAGSLSASATACLEGGTATLTGSVSGTYLPMGYAQGYVLARNIGGNMVVVDINGTPSFTVTTSGTYTIHTLVHDPVTFDFDAIQMGVTTTAEVNAMLVQGGGLYCAALDLVGATIVVSDCDGGECTAYAGTITPMLFETCLSDGSVTISAEGNNDVVVPAGYLVKYVLTMGVGLTIVDVADEPEFTVMLPGNYTIHTLVYHPSTLDLGLVVVGTTTGAQVNAMLIQGGGSICASLDLAGASTHVIDCSIDCAADAGTVTPILAEQCLIDGYALLAAMPGDDAFVPTGFEVMYVLTMGITPVIHAVSDEPWFIVSAEGTYRIHTLVYDPMTLDLGMVVLGTTPALTVTALLVQGGGDICASLDLPGALFTVTDCVDCTAFAGTLSADTVNVCLMEGSATLVAVAAGDAVVPAGYVMAHVLTNAGQLAIVGISDMPVFSVMAEGTYTMHTLIYDPTTLDLSAIVLGETPTLVVLEQLVQVGGPICASLDVSGVTFTVEDCMGAVTITNAWPVPAADQITVKLNVPVATPTELQVIDALGMQVMPGRAIAAGTDQVVIHLGGLVSGNYTLRLMNARGVSTYPIIKVN